MHYVIDIVVGNDCTANHVAREIKDITIARAEAIAAAREIVVKRLRAGEPLTPNWFVEIRDTAGAVVERLSMENIAFGTALQNRHRRVFWAVHHPYLLLTPEFDILEANPAYLNATLTDSETICHRALFDVFPDNPGDPEANGVRNLSASLSLMLRNKAPHFMKDQRYDIRRRDGSWEERHWRPVNLTVLDDNGEVEFVIHHVEDVTAMVHALAQLDFPDSR